MPARLTGVAAPLTFLLWTTVFAQSTTDAQRCEDFELYRHIRTTDPLPNRPLRRDDINDEEVGEVQRAALEVYPDFIVYISGVTDGCDCEDGGSCTAQIWLAMNRENQTRSLVLSKIDGHWKIGTVQSWLLQYNAHRKTFPGYGRGANQLAWQQENQRLLDNFPTCPTAQMDWKSLRTEKSGGTCIDMSSLKVSGSIRRVIIKHLHTPLNLPRFPWIRYGIDLEAYDCKDRRTRTDTSTLYFSDGTAQPGFVDDPVLWYPIRPGTDSAADLDFICGWSGK
jgi:hypothetical protein